MNALSPRLVTHPMQTLKDQLSVLMDHVPADRPIVYFDQPMHLNVGDLLINAGVEQLFKDNGRHVSHRLSLKDYARYLPHVPETHTLVLHGGGNFGDIWPAHENLRQTVLKRFQKNKVVVFPQTVHFNNTDNIENVAAAYRDHPDCMVFVRDRVSLDIIQNKFRVPCALSPDTAHQLWKSSPDFSARPEAQGTLTFLRKDREAAQTAGGAGGIDWDDLISLPDKLRGGACLAALLLNPLLSVQPALMQGWYANRDAIIRRCTRFFNRHARIRTDRLHAIILGMLLEKSVAMRDNNYGKLATYCDLWLPGLIERENQHQA